MITPGVRFRRHWPIRVLIGIGLAVAVLACGGEVPDPAAPSAPDDGPALAAVDLRYTCVLMAFGPELLEAGPGDDELANDPVAAALRAHLASPDMDVDFLPDGGWHLVGNDGRTAEFVVLDGDRGLKAVFLAFDANGWMVSGWGDCQPRLVLPPGLGDAEWWFDQAKPLPGPQTQVFDALVTEMNCNSGQPADGRIVGPGIVKEEDRVLVIFAVRPRPGGHDCPSNPSTRVVVDLGEPLGDRELLDGGRLPPGDPTEPRF